MAMEHDTIMHIQAHIDTLEFVDIATEEQGSSKGSLPLPNEHVQLGSWQQTFALRYHLVALVEMLQGISDNTLVDGIRQYYQLKSRRDINGLLHSAVCCDGLQDVSSKYPI